MYMDNKTNRTFSTKTIVILIIAPVLAMTVSLCLGRLIIPPAIILKSFLAKLGLSEGSSAQIETVIWGIRFPRILIAALVGAGLSLAGLAFQGIFSNPLATPDTLGVASGSSFGAVLGILLDFGLTGIQLIAMFFGLLAVFLTWVTGHGKNRGTTVMVLSGIMMGSLFNALISLVRYLANTETQLPAITYWLMGSLSGRGYSTLAIGSPLIITGCVILFLLRWRLNILPLNNDEAKASGTNIRALRAITILCAVGMTASCVSMCGQVGWVGLLVPHMCRMRFGNNHMKLVPTCISTGMTFVIIVDTIARSMATTEIPISILTAIIGAPYFIYLVRKNGGWSI